MILVFRAEGLLQTCGAESQGTSNKQGMVMPHEVTQRRLSTKPRVGVGTKARHCLWDAVFRKIMVCTSTAASGTSLRKVTLGPNEKKAL